MYQGPERRTRIRPDSKWEKFMDYCHNEARKMIEQKAKPCHVCGGVNCGLKGNLLHKSYG